MLPDRKHSSRLPPSHVIQRNAAVCNRDEFGCIGRCCSGPGHRSHLITSLVSHLKNLLMGIGVQQWNKSWTRCRPVFREKPARLVPDTTSIAKGFWPHWSCSPLWCLSNLTMHAFPNSLRRWILISLRRSQWN